MATNRYWCFPTNDRICFNNPKWIVSNGHLVSDCNDMLPRCGCCWIVVPMVRVFWNGDLLHGNYNLCPDIVRCRIRGVAGGGRISKHVCRCLDDALIDCFSFGRVCRVSCLREVVIRKYVESYIYCGTCYDAWILPIIFSDLKMKSENSQPGQQI